MPERLLEHGTPRGKLGKARSHALEYLLDRLNLATQQRYAYAGLDYSPLDSPMNLVTSFLLRWALTTLPLWVASSVLHGVSFSNVEALLISGLLLGFANAVIKPLLILFTLPITVLTLGLFIIVINTAILFFVHWLVPGFHIADLATGVLLALFISVFSFFVNRLVRP